MFTVALSGGIGCGKSTVCDLFMRQGVSIIDTDDIAHQLVEPGQPALQAIVEQFGKDILNKDQSLNRKALADRVFANPVLRQQLEAILHPRIRQQVQQQISKADSAYCIVAIPLLFETAQQSEYNRSLVVDCTEQQQLERTSHRDNRSNDEISAIMQSQVSRKERLKLANDVIDNSGEVDSLNRQVTALHKKYTELARQSIQ